MAVALLAARLVLAAVFAVAGIAKLLDLPGSRKSMRDFGVPAPLTGALGALLPLAELACAGALLWDTSYRWGAAGAAALLCLFIAGISVTLASGKSLSCHCFGQLSSSTVTWKTLLRNAILLVLPGFVWYFDEPLSLPDLTTFEAATLIALTALTVILVLTIWLAFHMLQQNGRLLVRLEAVEKKLNIDPNAKPIPGLPVGDPAPTFPSPEVVKTPALLMFTSAGCGACDALKPDIAQWQKEHVDRLTVVTITGQPEVSSAYLVTATPSAVLVKDGKIASVLSAGPDAIRELVLRSTLPPPVKKGDAVPALKLPDLSGTPVDLGALRGRRTLVLFWSPSCGYCQQMLEDLKKWERARTNGAPDLLIVSSGTADVNHEQGFQSPVLLDPIFGAGNVLGAGGTPSAVLIDENGRVASDVGVGAPAVLALADGRS